VAVVRRDQMLPSSCAEPVPVTSKRDTPQAKGDPISDAGEASVITYLRKGKTHCTAAVRKRSEKM